MPDTAALVEGVTNDAEPPRTKRRTVGMWTLVVTALLAVVVVTLLVRGAAEKSAQATAGMLQDVTVSKTYLELERQSRLPASESSGETLEAVLASPQSDRTGAIWETTVLSFSLGGDVYAARVATSYAPASSFSGPPSYLEFAVRVVPSTVAGTSPDILVCVVRTGTPAAPVATSEVALGAEGRMAMQPCPADVQRLLGFG